MVETVDRSGPTSRCGRSGAIALAVAAAVFLQACESANHERRLADFVEELTYGGPYDEGVPKDGKLHRWSSEIRVFVTGPGGDEHREGITDLTSDMAGLAGLAAAPAGNEAGANLVVRFSAEENFIVWEEFADCYATFKSLDREIVSAEIVIGRKGGETSISCLAHELMHAFGFAYHSGLARSVVSRAHVETSLTAWDRLAIGIIYDPRLEAGMGRAEARPIIEQLAKEKLRRHGGDLAIDPPGEDEMWRSF